MYLPATNNPSCDPFETPRMPIVPRLLRQNSEEFWEDPEDITFPDISSLESHRQGLDIGTDGRPAAKEENELTAKLECKVCMTQIVDTIVFPCGHVVMCRWCADQHVPFGKARQIGYQECPVCRKTVTEKVS